MNDWITIRITGTRGSVPREAGTWMQVSAEDSIGTIGGGALEWEAMRIARAMLIDEDGATEQARVMPLGPDLGQCCGGVVTLEFSRKTEAHPLTANPLVIWGAGHVGRAIAATLAPLQDRDITLVDTSQDRLPADIPSQVAPFIAADMPRAVPFMPAGADHLIVTYSHDIDLKLCDALLRGDAGFIGLIGSATKWARFQKRLRQMGHPDAVIARITCPIGDPDLGKHPQSIAIGVGHSLLRSPNRSPRAQGQIA